MSIIAYYSTVLTLLVYILEVCEESRASSAPQLDYMLQHFSFREDAAFQQPIPQNSRRQPFVEAEIENNLTYCDCLLYKFI